jgi:hypothetical protein
MSPPSTEQRAERGTTGRLGRARSSRRRPRYAAINAITGRKSTTFPAQVKAMSGQKSTPRLRTCVRARYALQPRPPSRDLRPSDRGGRRGLCLADRPQYQPADRAGPSLAVDDRACQTSPPSLRSSSQTIRRQVCRGGNRREPPQRRSGRDALATLSIVSKAGAADKREAERGMLRLAQQLEHRRMPDRT